MSARTLRLLDATHIVSAGRPSPAPDAAERSTPGWPLWGQAGHQRLEAQLLAGHPSGHWMERAGRGVAALAVALRHPAEAASPVEVFAGPGNNGGDGLVAARLLKAAGVPVRVWRMGGVSSRSNPGGRTETGGPEDAIEALRAAIAAGVPIADLASCPDAASSRPSLVIDALLGVSPRSVDSTTADTPVTRALLRAMDQIRQRRALGIPVLAVDLPSGLCPDTGRALLAGTSVSADHTLCLLGLKPGLFFDEGREAAGTLWWNPLHDALLHQAARDQVPPPVAMLNHAEPLHRLCASRWRDGRPRAGTHKGTHGQVLALGGAPGMEGALLLCGQSALWAGAGRVYLVPAAGDRTAPPSQPNAPAASLGFAPELMHRTAKEALALGGLVEQALTVAGCGGSASIAEFLPRVLRASPRLVLDADALNAIASDADLQRRLRQRRSHGQATVLTPHPTEAARLLGRSTEAVQANRLDAAAALSRALDCVVVLKGVGSVIAAPGGFPPRLNPTGNSRLATAGSGDVLAGWIGGLWAANPTAQPDEVAAACVWLHGHAVDGVEEAPSGAGDSAPWVLPAGGLARQMAERLTAVLRSR